MGSRRNKVRKAKFNRKPGIHSATYKRKQFLKVKKGWAIRKTLKKIKCQPYQIRRITVNHNKTVKYVVRRIPTMTKQLKAVHLNKGNQLKLLQRPLLDGSRIVNIEKLEGHVGDITIHTALCESARKLAAEGQCVTKFISERLNGLATIICIRCEGCQKEFKIESSEKVNCQDRQEYDINVRAVWGAMATGKGAESLNESMGTMGIPGLDRRRFSKIENTISHWWEEVLAKDIMRNGEIEKALAEENNEYFQGIPAVAVVCDGGWSKRSHKHTYNALGGVGVIFGKRTSKLLHLGIRNKHCYICQVAQNSQKEAKEHECFKNWDESSQAMESDIIVEGFQIAEKRHGLRYMWMVGDGDSSVYANILKNVPVWGQHVKKLECANHACKCLRTNLEKLVESNPSYKGKGKLTKLKRMRMVIGVRCAIKMRSNETDRAEATKKLRHDIRNSAYHAFGHHDKCSKDFCKTKTNESIKNVDICSEEPCDDGENQHIDDVVEDVLISQCSFWGDSVSSDSTQVFTGGEECQELHKELMSDIYFILNRMAEKSDRLIGNFTTNLAEGWMNVRSKFDGGKIYNRCNRGSWNARCYGGALRKDYGPAWSPVVYQEVTGHRPTAPFTNIYRKRSKQLQYSLKSQNKPEVKERKRKRKMTSVREGTSKKAKEAYGNVLDDSEDVSKEVLEKKCNSYRDSLSVTSKVRCEIENNTKDQSNSKLWVDERRKRLTSSWFHQVITRSPSNNSTILVERILYKQFKGTMYMKAGLQLENITIKEYINEKLKAGQTVKVEKVGLVISEQEPWLAASTDGKIKYDNGNEGLLEIKNLLQTKSLTLRQAAVQVKGFCLSLQNGQLRLKHNHQYYHQVQGQMNIMQMVWTDFVVRTTNPYDMHIERIERDPVYWQSNMLPKLTCFYMRQLLPELAVPRHGSVTGIRKPDTPWFVDPNRKSKTGKGKAQQNKGPIPSTSGTNTAHVTGPTPSTSGTDTAHVTGPTPSTSGTDTAHVTRPTPSTSGTDTAREQTTLSSATKIVPPTCTRPRRKSTKFVGRRISHEWIVDEATGETAWYSGIVLDVAGNGADGHPNTEYNVLYDDDTDHHIVDHLQEDLSKGSLKFIDL